MDWNYIEETLKLLKEAKESGEEVSIQCPVDDCNECPFFDYCE